MRVHRLIWPNDPRPIPIGDDRNRTANKHASNASCQEGAGSALGGEGSDRAREN